MSPVRRLCLLAFLLVAAALPSLAAVSPDSTCTPSRLSVLAGGAIHSTWIETAVINGVSYTTVFAGGDNGVLSLDATIPSQIDFRGEIGTSAPVRDLYFDGTHLFAAVEERGLFIYETTSRGTLNPVGQFDSSGFSFAAAVSGSVAFLADGYSGLLAIDVSNPAAPSQLGQYVSPEPILDVALSGTFAYLAAGVNGLLIVDVSVPSNPTLVGSTIVPGFALGVAIQGNTAYVANGTGLVTVNVSSKTSPVVLASLYVPNYTPSVTLIGNTAYLPSSEAGITVIDVTNPSIPSWLSTIDTPGIAMALTNSGNRAALADLDRGVQILDTTTPSAPFLLGGYRGPALAHSVRAVQTILLAAVDQQGMMIIDATNPDFPEIVSTLPLEGRAVDVLPFGSLAFVANLDQGFQVVDITDLANPVLLTNLPLPGGQPWGLAEQNGYAFVANGNGGLVVIDVTTPTTPVVIGSIPLPSVAKAVTLTKGLALVADLNSGLEIVDLKDPAHPALLSHFTPGGQVLGVDVAGDIAYVAAGGIGVFAVSIARPDFPLVLGTLDTPGNASGLKFAGPELFVADGPSGIRVLDFENPSSPSTKGSVALTGSSASITIANDLAYLATEDGGIQILDIFSCLSNVPKPVASFATDPETLCSGQSIAFRDTSSGKPFVWDWDFGDGTRTTEQNPYHRYDTAGSYDVTLTVKNQSGTSATSVTVQVILPPAITELASPVSGTIDIEPYDVPFSWIDTPLARNYALQIWNGDSCADPLVSFFPITKTGFTVGSLPPGEIYSWNVTAANDCGSGETSTCFVFGVAPRADFSISPVPACAGQPVSFGNAAIGNIASWSWDFGDGTEGEGPNPVHFYQTTGHFDVTLRVAGASGDDVKKLSVDVTDRPIPSFSFSLSPIPTGSPVRLLDTSGRGPESWAWDFGDGTTSFEKDPTHVFDAPGFYLVSLAVTNSCGTTNTAALASVGSPPRPGASHEPEFPCVGREVHFSDSTSPSSETTWSWDFGDDGLLEGGSHPIHVYSHAGTYLVTLDVSNPWGTTRTLESVHVFGDPLPGFRVDPETSFSGLPVQLTSQSAGGTSRAHWDFGDGAISDETNPTHIFVAAGDYRVELRASNGCREASLARIVHVSAPEPPAARFQSASTAVAGSPFSFEDQSKGTVTEWSWDFGDGSGASTAETAHTFASAGRYDVSLTVRGPAGSSTSAPISITVREPVFPAVPDFLFIPTNPRTGDSVTFVADTSASGNDVFWGADDGWQTKGITAAHAFGAPGDHVVRVDAAGVVSVRIVTVLPASPAADFDFTPPNAVLGRRVVFRALSSDSATVWHWDFGDGSSADGASAEHTFGDVGDYPVVARGKLGGSSVEARRIVSVRGGDLPAPPSRRWLPAVIRQSSSNGIVWRTEPVLFNPNRADAAFRWRFIPWGVPGESVPWVSGVLGPRQSSGGAELLELSFGLSGTDFAGMVELESSSSLGLPIQFQSRLTTLGGAGSFGEMIPALTIDETGKNVGIRVAGFSENENTSTSFGVVNARGAAGVATLILRDGKGIELARQTVTMPGLSSIQQTVKEWFPDIDSPSLAPFVVELVGPAGLDLYGTVFDARSHDLRFLSHSEASQHVIVGNVVHDEGANPEDGESVETDIVLSNPNGDHAVVDLILRSGGASESRSVDLASGETRILRDAAGAGLFGLDAWEGTIEISTGAFPGIETAAVTFREGGAAGTRGTAAPVLTGGDSASPGGLRRSIAASGLREGNVRGGAWTSELEIISTGPVGATIDLVFRDSGGQTILERKGIGIPAGFAIHLESPLAELGRDVDQASVEMTVQSGAGAASVRLVDRFSGDSSISILR